MKLANKLRDKNIQRVGRGGTRGKTSGRGHKGQRSRAGHCIRPAFRDLLEKIPKLRGHNKNRAKGVIGSKTPIIGVNLDILEKYFNEGDHIVPKSFVDKNLLSKNKGQNPKIKILSKGDITKAINISHCTISKSAKEKIISAGGKVI